MKISLLSGQGYDLASVTPDKIRIYCSNKR